MEWLDVKKFDPPFEVDILFMLGDGTVHIGEIFPNIFIQGKVKKLAFHSYTDHEDYHCDLKTPINERVIYWHTLPKMPD